MLQTGVRTECENDIYCRHKGKILVKVAPAGTQAEPADTVYLATFVKNLHSVGFRLTDEVVTAAAKLSLPELTSLNNELLAVLAYHKGYFQKLEPLYPNFPSQVMKMSEAELYFNAALHYLTGGIFKPKTLKLPRPALSEEGSLVEIGLGSREEFESIFFNLVKSVVSFSPVNQAELSWFLTGYERAEALIDSLAADFPNRENKIYLLKLILERDPDFVLKHLTTTIDVLRLACAINGGDVSLAKPTRFAQLKRPHRRLMLKALESCSNLEEDLRRYKGRFLRLAERLHPGEFARLYPKTFAAFQGLRHNKKLETFNQQVELRFTEGNLEQLLQVLKSRPGLFARRLDHLLRRFPEQNTTVIDAFEAVSDGITTAMLLQLRTHFGERCKKDKAEKRVFLPKGQVTKAMAVDNQLADLDESVCLRLLVLCEKLLKARFAKLPPLGRCYLSPALVNFNLPFALRSASKSFRTMARGSRLALPDKDTLRFFLFWRNGRGRADVDLSAVFFDKDFNYLDAVTYYNLKSYGGVHSGDIVDAPQGASEFIDVSISLLMEKKVRYVVPVIKAFTHEPFCDLPECFTGWMARQKPGSGEIYEPRLVEDRLDITSDSRIAIPAVFDLRERQLIWADLALTRWPLWITTVAANLWGIQLMLKSMVMLKKPNVYDLLKLHIEARGSFCDSREGADHCLSVEDGTPFDLAKLAGEFMQN